MAVAGYRGQEVDVTLERRRVLKSRGHSRTGRDARTSTPHHCFDRIFLSVGQLRSVGAEKFDPVVGSRVVRGRNDGSHRGAGDSGQMGDPSRRHDPHVDGVDAR